MNEIKEEKHFLLSDFVKKILYQNRIVTTVDFLQEDVQKLSTITKLTLQQVMALRNDLITKYTPPLQNGYELYLKRLNKRIYLKTSIQSLDTLLSGGLPIGYITEICGLADTGKTQLCSQIAINCAKRNDIVVYIDTKGDFSAVRIQKMLDLCGHSHKDMALIMFKIRIINVWTLEELLNLLQQLKEKKYDIENVSLIIIDSLPSLMLQYLGDNNKTGLTLLNEVVNKSRYIAKQFEIAFICVNIQTRWVEVDVLDEDYDNSLKDPAYIEKRNRCLGKYWDQIPATILLLHKLTNDANDQSTHLTVTLARSFDSNKDQCTIILNGLGICNMLNFNSNK